VRVCRTSIVASLEYFHSVKRLNSPLKSTDPKRDFDEEGTRPEVAANESLPTSSAVVRPSLQHETTLLSGVCIPDRLSTIASQNEAIRFSFATIRTC
jgi:hypothetical protein